MPNLLTTSCRKAKRSPGQGFSRADTLIEVIISFFIIALGSTVATSLVVNSINSNSYSRNNLVAMNLAVEGIEAVRNIRDNNWLKFNFDKENCWNMRPEAASTATCDAAGGKLIQPGDYSIDMNPENMRWSLSDPFATELDLANYTALMDDAYRIAYVDLDGGSDHELFLSRHSQTGLTPPASMNDDSPYYRMVKIDYGGTPADTAEEMTVKSIVQWNESNGVKTIELDTVLANYNRVKVNP